MGSTSVRCVFIHVDRCTKGLADPAMMMHMHARSARTCLRTFVPEVAENGRQHGTLAWMVGMTNNTTCASRVTYTKIDTCIEESCWLARNRTGSTRKVQPLPHDEVTKESVDLSSRTKAGVRSNGACPIRSLSNHKSAVGKVLPSFSPQQLRTLNLEPRQEVCSSTIDSLHP